MVSCVHTTRRSDLLVERDGGGEVEQHEGDDHVGHGELRTHDTTQWLTCRTWWWGEVEQHEGDDHVGHGELPTHDAVTYL